jgi:hypothetical protein
VQFITKSDFPLEKNGKISDGEPQGQAEHRPPNPKNASRPVLDVCLFFAEGASQRFRNLCRLLPVSTETKRTTLILSGLLALACGLFLTGIQWGLPSHASDPFLFGNRTPWTGEQILSLAPGWADDANRGADVAAHPLADRDKPIIVNQTDSQRAAIIRRYRLYSDQPDEMITLRALAQMNPGKLRFDPKLYQYGGLWVYPIAAILKGLTPFRLVHLTSDLAFYLDHPEAFGRLYVVMRLYSAAWGIVGGIVMFRLATRISQSQLIGATAAICYMLLPTVINGAHEAKPHLAGAVLGLIATDFALRAIETGKTRWAIATGIACGAAAGMVLSEWLIIGLLPVLAYFLPTRRLLSLLFACAAALATYAITNPYVIIHLLGDRTVLASNLGNSAAMYQAPASFDGLMNGLVLLLEGGSFAVPFGLLATIQALSRRQPLGWLLIAATLPALLLFLAHATRKHEEYARFALPMDTLWVLGCAYGVCTLDTANWRRSVTVILLISLLWTSLPYVLNFWHDAGGETTRLRAAQRLEHYFPTGAYTVYVDAEPAPYATPPLDLFRWQMILLPGNAALPPDADVRVDATRGVGPDFKYIQSLIDSPFFDAPISWAEKPFRIEIRQDVFAAVRQRLQAEDSSAGSGDRR